MGQDEMMLGAAQKREPTTDGRISDRKFNTILTLSFFFASKQKRQEEYREKL